MNIRDPSKQTIIWTNTTSVNVSVLAIDIAPWFVGHRDWPRYNNLTHFNSTLSGTYLNGTEALGYTLENFTYFPDAVTSNTPIHVSKTYLVSDSPGNYSWPIWIFEVIARALVFGSIILLLIGGRVCRSIARFSLRRRRTFLSIISLMWTL